MWGGVDKGLAGVKLSGSPRRFGENSVRVSSRASIKMTPKRSLYEK